MNVNTSTAGGISNDHGQSAPPSSPLGQVDRELSDRFLSTLKRGQDRRQDQAGYGHGSGDDMMRHDLESGSVSPSVDPMEGDALSSLFSASFSGLSSPLDALFSTRAESVPPAASAMDDGSMEQLVERILVSAPEDGSREVRLTLGGDRLAGTEVILNRASDGSLAITLNTSDASTFQTLVSARDSLKQALERHEGQEVRVNIDHDRGDGGNDTDRRSRGLMPEDIPEL